MLPKSLHTVRILVAVAHEAQLVALDSGRYFHEQDARMAAILCAATIIGYPDALATDPLIVKAAAQLAAQSVRAAA